MNRKRIFAAIGVYENYTQDQKTKIINSILEYFPELQNGENQILMNNAKDLEHITYCMLQRVYTTVDGEKKVIATSIKTII